MRPIRCSRSIGFHGKSKLNRIRACWRLIPSLPAAVQISTRGPSAALNRRSAATLAPWSPPFSTVTPWPGYAVSDLRPEHLDTAQVGGEDDHVFLRVFAPEHTQSPQKLFYFGFALGRELRQQFL